MNLLNIAGFSTISAFLVIIATDDEFNYYASDTIHNAMALNITSNLNSIRQPEKSILNCSYEDKKEYGFNDDP